jgi:hypothetical protein
MAGSAAEQELLGQYSPHGVTGDAPKVQRLADAIGADVQKMWDEARRVIRLQKRAETRRRTWAAM